MSQGCYPDCDMLPIGHISIRGCEHGLTDRQTRLSKEEQRTMFTLWCIFRSPMMLGCELTDMDEWTKSLVTNDEEGNTYAAFFNITNWEETFSVSLKQLGLEGKCQVHDMWSGEDLGEAEEVIEVTLKSHDAMLYKMV